MRAAVGLIQLQRTGRAAVFGCDIERKVDALSVALGIGEGHRRPREAANVELFGNVAGHGDAEAGVGVGGAVYKAVSCAFDNNRRAGRENRRHGRRAAYSVLDRRLQVALVKAIGVRNGVSDGASGLTADNIVVHNSDAGCGVRGVIVFEAAANGVYAQHQRARTNGDRRNRTECAQPEQARTAGYRCHHTAGVGRHGGIIEQNAGGRGGRLVAGCRQGPDQWCGSRSSRSTAAGDVAAYARAQVEHTGAVDEVVVRGHQQRLVVRQLHQNGAIRELDVRHNLGRCRSIAIRRLRRCRPGNKGKTDADQRG